MHRQSHRSGRKHYGGTYDVVCGLLDNFVRDLWGRERPCASALGVKFDDPRFEQALNGREWSVCDAAEIVCMSTHHGCEDGLVVCSKAILLRLLTGSAHDEVVQVERDVALR